MVVTLVPGRIAVAAHVDQEHVEQRPISDFAIDAAGLSGDRPDRHEFEKRAARTRHQARSAVRVVTGRVDAADRRPVVGHFVIVPLREHCHLRVEGAQVLVEQVVFIVAAKLCDAVCDLGFLRRHDIAPNVAVRQLQFRRHRAVGVDVIAGMNEEVRTVFQHGPVGAHAAAGGIDAPALACGIAGPDERNLVMHRGRGAEMTDLGFAGEATRAIRETQAIEDILSWGKIFQLYFGGEIGIRQRVRRCRAKNGVEAFDGGAFHLHARRSLSAPPHHGGAGGDIARLYAARDLRAIGSAAEIGFCLTAQACECNRGSGADQQLTSRQGPLRAYRNRHSENLRRITTKVARST